MFDSETAVSFVQTHALNWGTNLVLALLIFLVGRWVSKGVVSLAGRLLRQAKMDEILVNFITSILGAMLLLVVIVAALDRLGVDTTSLIAVIGAAGLAIGLSLQDSLKNFAAGVMLIVFRPFKAGDFIEAAGAAGVVEQINIFSTTLRTPDNREVIIPNGAIYGGNITNYSARDTRRIDLLLGIGYGDDLRLAKAILEGVLAADERILADPAPLVAVADLAESSVNIHVRPWVRSSDYFSVLCDLKERIKLAFDDNGISIPFPQRDLHLYHHGSGSTLPEESAAA